MDHDEKKLKKQLQEMQIGYEVKKEQRKAAKLRRGVPPRSEDEPFDAHAFLGADAEVLDDLAPATRLRRRFGPPPAVVLDAVAAAAGHRSGTVSGVFAGVCRVLLDGVERDCRLAPALAAEQIMELLQ